MLMNVKSGVYTRIDPTAAAAPVLFETPRSGGKYPHDFRTIALLKDLQRSISMYVEECYLDVVDSGATWLFAEFPNIYIDLNRNELDIDPSQLTGKWPVALQPGPKTKTELVSSPRSALEQSLSTMRLSRSPRSQTVSTTTTGPTTTR